MNRATKAIGWMLAVVVLTFIMAFLACGCASVTGAQTELRSDKTTTYYEKGKHVRIVMSTPAPAKESAK